MSYHPQGINPIQDGHAISALWGEDIEDRLDALEAAGASATAQADAYVVRVNGGLYEAWKDGALTFGGASDAGSIDGTDFADVVQACLDAAPATGTSIAIQPGPYYPTHSISLPTVANYGYGPIPIDIYGSRSTYIVWNDPGAGNIFESSDNTEYVSHFSLRDLTLYGNSKVANGVYIENMFACTLERVVAAECNYGIWLNGTAATFANENTLIDCFAKTCNYGFYLGTEETNGNSLINCKSFGNVQSALTLAYHAYYNNIFGGDYSNTSAGPNINIIGDALHPTSQNKFFGTYSESGVAVDFKVYADAGVNHFYGCKCDNFMNDSAYKQYYNGGVLITASGAHEELVITGSNTYNWVTKNGGNVQINSLDNIAHGLSTTPNVVSIIPIEAGVTDFYVNSVDATNIQVVFTGAGPKWFSWGAEVV